MVEEDPPTPLREGEVPPPPLLAEEQADQQDVGHSPAPSLDLDEHEELPTELSDSLEKHDEGEPAWFHAEEEWSFTDRLLENGSHEICSLDEIL